MREYVFVDQYRLNSYVEQIPSAIGKLTKRTVRASASPTSPSVEVTREETEKALNTHEKIVALQAHLAKEKLLARRRPLAMNGENGQPFEQRPFILESTLATKVVFPTSGLSTVPGLKGLALWVSDPNPKQLSLEPWEFRGTFLLLPEAVWDDSPVDSVYSGCSALQAVVNVATGMPFLTAPDGEALGRGSERHPLDKLASAGAVIGDQRRIAHCTGSATSRTSSATFTRDSRTVSTIF